jgi:hypothetical protein
MDVQSGDYAYSRPGIRPQRKRLTVLAITIIAKMMIAVIFI